MTAENGGCDPAARHPEARRRRRRAPRPPRTPKSAPARAHEPRTPPQAKVAILTAGGLAPCLSSAVGFLIEKYTARNPSIEIICYISGYKGLLSGEHVKVTEAVRENASVLQLHGGSPINSRVKLTNVETA